MAWIYRTNLCESLPCSQEQAADCSQADCSDGGQSARSKTTPTGKRSCSRGKKTARSILSRYGMTFGLSTEQRGVDAWISYLRGSHANHIVPRASNLENDIRTTCGQTPSAVFAKLDQHSRSWKTLQGCLIPGDIWEPFCATWPKRGIQRGGRAYRLPMLAHRTNASGFGFIATPTKKANQAAPSMVAKHKGCRRMVPTANAMRGHNAGTFQELGGSGNIYRGGQIASIRINPAYWEWLMGWPIGWTDLVQSGTGKSRCAQQSHFKCWPTDMRGEMDRMIKPSTDDHWE
jgi:hypothetical protein